MNPFPCTEDTEINPSRQHAQQRVVLLFGEVLADVFPDRNVLGGAPFNVAWHLQAFGLEPVLITALGDDALGREVLRAMDKHRMATMGVQCGSRYPTGRVQVHIIDGGHRFEILPDQAYDAIEEDRGRAAALTARPSLFYFGTLAQRQEISRNTLLSLLQGAPATKFLDINLRGPWFSEEIIRQSLQHADIVKLNVDELTFLTEMFALSIGDRLYQVKELIKKFDLLQVIVTCGAQGAWQVDSSGTITEASAGNRIVRPVDTVGAGDGFAAVWLLGMLRRWSVATTLERANTFASTLCGIRGAVPDSEDFYTPFWTEWRL